MFCGQTVTSKLTRTAPFPEEVLVADRKQTSFDRQKSHREMTLSKNDGESFLPRHYDTKHAASDPECPGSLDVRFLNTNFTVRQILQRIVIVSLLILAVVVVVVVLLAQGREYVGLSTSWMDSCRSHCLLHESDRHAGVSISSVKIGCLSECRLSTHLFARGRSSTRWR